MYTKSNVYANTALLSSYFFVKFVYSGKATRFCEISTLLLSTIHTDKSKVEISQNFVAFSDYMNFTEKTLKVKNNFSCNKSKVRNFCL